MLVEHRADTAVGRTRDDGVTDVQRAGLDQHRGRGATATVEVGLDRDTAGVAVGVGAQVEVLHPGAEPHEQRTADEGAGADERDGVPEPAEHRPFAFPGDELHRIAFFARGGTDLRGQRGGSQASLPEIPQHV